MRGSEDHRRADVALKGTTWGKTVQIMRLFCFFLLLILSLKRLACLSCGRNEPVWSAEPAPNATDTPPASQSRKSLSNMYQWSRSGPRAGRLYCRVGIGFHLQIHPDGGVSGSHRANQFSILEIFAVAPGIVGIRGTFSDRFLAMNKKGKVYAATTFTNESKFRERYQENSYNTYASATYRNHQTGREWYVALNKRGKVKKGNSPQVKPQHISTHFLPRFKHSEKEKTFTITNKTPERTTPPIPPKTPPPVKVSRKNTNTVKYRPKFRFG